MNRNHGESILVIDDVEEVREMAALLLEAEGFDVLRAASTREGYEIWKGKRHTMKLVILDLSLPDGSGEMFAAQLRKIEPDVRILFTSGYTREYLGYDPAKAHAWFLEKPWQKEQLIEIVQRCLAAPPGAH